MLLDFLKVLDRCRGLDKHRSQVVPEAGEILEFGLSVYNCGRLVFAFRGVLATLPSFSTQANSFLNSSGATRNEITPAGTESLARVVMLEETTSH